MQQLQVAEKFEATWPTEGRQTVCVILVIVFAFECEKAQFTQEPAVDELHGLRSRHGEQDQAIDPGPRGALAQRVYRGQEHVHRGVDFYQSSRKLYWSTHASCNKDCERLEPAALVHLENGLLSVPQLSFLGTAIAQISAGTLNTDEFSASGRAILLQPSCQRETRRVDPRRCLGRLQQLSQLTFFPIADGGFATGHRCGLLRESS